MNIDTGVLYKCTNGGNVRIIKDAEDVSLTGVDNGYAFFNDIYINATDDMFLDISSNEINGTLEHESGDVIFSFRLISDVPSGIADIKFKNLNPHNWYRLKINSEFIPTQYGKTHGKTNNDGIITFNQVNIPNE